MFATVAHVTDLDRFLQAFATVGADKRREHGCRGAQVFRDPDQPDRVWCLFDWDEEDYAGFLADPGVPAVARALALREPPVRVDPVADLDH